MSVAAVVAEAGLRVVEADMLGDSKGELASWLQRMRELVLRRYGRFDVFR